MPVLGSGELISGDMETPVPYDNGVANHSPSEMSELTGDFDRKTGTPLWGSGESVVMQRMQPFMEALWLDFGASWNTQRPKSDGSSISNRAGEISYRRHKIRFRALDLGIRTMILRSAKPAGRYPRLPGSVS